jgi:hypothetical protein
MTLRRLSFALCVGLAAGCGGATTGPRQGGAGADGGTPASDAPNVVGDAHAPIDVGSSEVS